jgi:SRSO17 transposase
MQHLLARASWDTDGVRDDLRDYVTGQLGDADAVIVFDETGDLKKGSCTVGVQRPTVSMVTALLDGMVEWTGETCPGTPSTTNPEPD